MAAAPQMLEALEILISRPKDYLLTEDREMIINAIQKAKGYGQIVIKANDLPKMLKIGPNGEVLE